MKENNYIKLILHKLFRKPIQISAAIVFITTAISWAAPEIFICNNSHLRPQPALERDTAAEELSAALGSLPPEIREAVDAILSDPDVQFFKRAGWVEVKPRSGASIVRISIINPANPDERNMGLLISSYAENQYSLTTFTPFGPQPGRTIQGTASLPEAARAEWGNLKRNRPYREWLIAARDQIFPTEAGPSRLALRLNYAIKDGGIEKFEDMIRAARQIAEQEGRPNLVGAIEAISTEKNYTNSMLQRRFLVSDYYLTPNETEMIEVCLGLNEEGPWVSYRREDDKYSRKREAKLNELISRASTPRNSYSALLRDLVFISENLREGPRADKTLSKRLLKRLIKLSKEVMESRDEELTSFAIEILQYIPSDESAKIIIAKFPEVQSQATLDTLVRYPEYPDEMYMFVPQATYKALRYLVETYRPPTLSLEVYAQAVDMLNRHVEVNLAAETSSVNSREFFRDTRAIIAGAREIIRVCRQITFDTPKQFRPYPNTSLAYI